jgi:hypothetical protein
VQIVRPAPVLVVSCTRVATADNEAVRRAIRGYLGCTAEVVESFRVVELDDCAFAASEILSRGIVCRQHDYLGVSLSMAVDGHGWAILPLVRPAVEELLWLSVLAEIAPPKRDRLVLAMVHLGALSDLEAQAAFTDADYMAERGLAAVADRLGPGKAAACQRARDIFRELGFSLRRGSHVPSTDAIAERGGRLPLYRFLYHASSTAVHFKPDQIMRGIWGERDSMRIDLRQVELTRGIFGTFWSLWLARETLRTAIPISGDIDLPPPNPSALAEVERLLAQVGYPPFIEADEFRT